MPGKASSRGRMTQSAAERISSGETSGELACNATSMIPPMMELIGPSTGVKPVGSRPVASASLSATICRSREMADARGGANALDVGGAIDGIFERKRDLDLHLFRDKPRRLGEDGDCRTVQVREDVHRELRQHYVAAVEQQEDCQADNSQPMLEGKPDDAVEHIFWGTPPVVELCESEALLLVGGRSFTHLRRHWGRGGGR